MNYRSSLDKYKIATIHTLPNSNQHYTSKIEYNTTYNKPIKSLYNIQNNTNINKPKVKDYSSQVLNTVSNTNNIRTYSNENNNNKHVHKRNLNAIKLNIDILNNKLNELNYLTSHNIDNIDNILNKKDHLYNNNYTTNNIKTTQINNIFNTNENLNSGYLINNYINDNNTGGTRNNINKNIIQRNKNSINYNNNYNSYGFSYDFNAYNKRSIKNNDNNEYNDINFGNQFSNANAININNTRNCNSNYSSMYSCFYDNNISPPISNDYNNTQNNFYSLKYKKNLAKFNEMFQTKDKEKNNNALVNQYQHKTPSLKRTRLVTKKSKPNNKKSIDKKSCFLESKAKEETPISLNKNLNNISVSDDSLSDIAADLAETIESEIKDKEIKRYLKNIKNSINVSNNLNNMNVETSENNKNNNLISNKNKLINTKEKFLEDEKGIQSIIENDMDNKVYHFKNNTLKTSKATINSIFKTKKNISLKKVSKLEKSDTINANSNNCSKQITNESINNLTITNSNCKENIDNSSSVINREKIVENKKNDSTKEDKKANETITNISMNINVKDNIINNNTMKSEQELQKENSNNNKCQEINNFIDKSNNKCCLHNNTSENNSNKKEINEITNSKEDTNSNNTSENEEKIFAEILETAKRAEEQELAEKLNEANNKQSTLPLKEISSSSITSNSNINSNLTQIPRIKKSKRVSFNDKANVTISFTEFEKINKLSVSNSIGQKIKFKPKFDYYSYSLVLKRGSNNLKPSIINCAPIRKRNSSYEKKYDTKSPMERNIELIKTIKQTKTNRRNLSINNTKVPSERKVKSNIPVPHCEKFVSNPQRFFTENLCDETLEYYGIKKKNNKLNKYRRSLSTQLDKQYLFKRDGRNSNFSSLRISDRYHAGKKKANSISKDNGTKNEVGTKEGKKTKFMFNSIKQYFEDLV